MPGSDRRAAIFAGINQALCMTTMRLTVDALDTLIAPNLSALKVCGAQLVAELPSYTGALRLNQAIGLRYPESIQALLLGFMGRLRTAISEYNFGRERLHSYVEAFPTEQRFSDHTRALVHFESSVLQLRVAIDCLHGAGKIMCLPRLYENKDGSHYDRLREISNRIKHFDEDVLKAVKDGGSIPIAPVWLTNTGLSASTAHLTFAEIEQIMRDQSIDAEEFSVNIPRRAIERRKAQEGAGSDQ